jgi:hypothetical protein
LAEYFPQGVALGWGWAAPLGLSAKPIFSKQSVILSWSKDQFGLPFPSNGTDPATRVCDSACAIAQLYSFTFYRAPKAQPQDDRILKRSLLQRSPLGLKTGAIINGVVFGYRGHWPKDQNHSSLHFFPDIPPLQADIL